MFGCYCLYCDGQAVGWIHDSVLSLREVGLDYLPDDIKTDWLIAARDMYNFIVQNLQYIDEHDKQGYDEWLVSNC